MMSADFIAGFVIGYLIRFVVEVSEAFKAWLIRKLSENE